MSIFNKQATPAEGAPQAPTPEELKSLNDLLGGIKNEAGEQKYKDVQSALTALQHSQEYIPDLKTQNEQLARDLEEAKAKAAKLGDLEGIVQKLTEKQAPAGIPPASGLDEQSVTKLLEQQLSQREAAKVAQANSDLVSAELEAKFGTEAMAKFEAKAKELGLATEYLQSLAEQSPAAVLAHFPKPTKEPSVNSGGFNTAAFNIEKPTHNQVPRAEQSVLAGATTGELASEFARHKQFVYDKHQVTG